MKKAILITTAILGTSAAVVTTSTFLALSKKEIINSKQFSYISSHKPLNYDNLANINVDFKKLILGTNQVNNGNYILYIGTQGNISNLNFMIDNESNNISSINDLKNNYNIKTNGLLAKVIENTNTSFELGVLESKPEFYGLVDTLNSDIFKQKEDYENLVKRLRSSTIENEKKWADAAASEYSFDFTKKYKDLNGNEVYFRVDKQAQNMRFIMDFVKDYLKSKNIKNLNDKDSPGLILLYTNGNLQNGPRVFNDSRNFDESKQENKETYPSGQFSYNSIDNKYGGELNAAIYATYKKQK